MLANPTHERLIALGLTGMAKAFEEQRRSPDLDALSFEERIGLLVDREAAERDTKWLTTRLKFAALRQSACVEDVDLRTPRGIDRAVFARLVGGDWIDRYENLLVTGATGLGRLACALGHKACRDNDRYSIIASRVSSRRSRWRAATGAMAACSRRSGAFNSSTLTTGACRSSTPPSAATSWKSSMIATAAHPQSSQAKSPWNTGTMLSAIPRSVMRSWIASFTTLTAFNSPEKACENTTLAAHALDAAANT